MKKWIFRVSIFLNVLTAIGLLLNSFSAPYKLGVLKEDIAIGVFGGKKTLFKLPKGITVQDISERGLNAIDQFENHRFQVVITSDRELVDYSKSGEQLNSTGNFYSADIK